MNGEGGKNEDLPEQPKYAAYSVNRLCKQILPPVPVDCLCPGC